RRRHTRFSRDWSSDVCSSDLYAARANLNPTLITGIEVGGQLTTTTDVDNWPGDNDGVQGPELMQRMQKHAERFETKIVYDTINEIGRASCRERVLMSIGVWGL